MQADSNSVLLRFQTGGRTVEDVAPVSDAHALRYVSDVI